MLELKWNKEFELTKEHIKLISKMYVDYSQAEFGAPEIDPKRPYGNTSVYEDIAEILCIKAVGGNREEGFEFNQEQINYMQKLHEETQYALQIVLCMKSFKTGKFVSGDYGFTWKRIK